MKINDLIFLVIVLAIFSCQSEKPADKTQSFQSFGAKFDSVGANDISKLDLLMKDQDSVAVTLTATIEKTCAVKGCWMQLKTNNENALRVTFKDYGFFVPKTGMEGKTATIQGYCIKRETSIEELRHYAQDAGESEEFIASITAPKTEFNFVASGVMIED